MSKKFLEWENGSITEEQIELLVFLIGDSIKAHIISLFGQMKDYGYHPTIKQLNELSRIQFDLYSIVTEITNPSINNMV